MVLPGQERMVSLSDRPHLPYTEAVFRETMRMFPVLPVGFPRATSCDVEIRKFLNPTNVGSQYIGGLGQGCSIPSALAMRILQSCTISWTGTCSSLFLETSWYLTTPVHQRRVVTTKFSLGSQFRYQSFEFVSENHVFSQWRI